MISSHCNNYFDQVHDHSGVQIANKIMYRQLKYADQHQVTRRMGIIFTNTVLFSTLSVIISVLQ